MATDLYTFTGYGPQVLTLTDADTTYKVTLPHGCKSLFARPKVNDARYNSQDVAMTASDDFTLLDADGGMVIDITRVEHGHPGVIYFATGTAGTELELTPSPTRGA